MNMLILLAIALVLSTIYVACAIYVMRELKHAREELNEERQWSEKLTTLIPLGAYEEGEELTPWNVLQNIEFKEEEQEDV